MVRCPVETKHLTKEHGTSCLSSQGTNQMIIQATQSSNWRHSSKLVGTFNLFIPCCRQGRAPKADFKPLFLFCSRRSRIRTDDVMRPRHALYQAELHSDCCALIMRPFDIKINVIFCFFICILAYVHYIYFALKKEKDVF